MRFIILTLVLIYFSISFSLGFATPIDKSIHTKTHPTTKDIYDSADDDTVQMIVTDGWNLISLPLMIPNARVNDIFPSAISNAFIYDGSYVSKDTIEFGKGYWLKFAASETISIIGTSVSNSTVFLSPGWNMIGTISFPVDTITVLTDPINILISGYFAYDTETGYYNVDRLLPGKGYWVKASQGGMMVHNCWQKPDLISPTDTNIPESLEVKLIWKKPFCENFYRVQVSKDSLFMNMLLDTVTMDTTYALNNLEYATEYIWRVATITPMNDTLWSSRARFCTMWEYIGLAWQNIYSIIPLDSSIIFASSGSGIYKTTNGGQRWDTLLSMRISELQMHPYNPKILYASIAAYTDPPYGFLKTTDGGKNWFFVNNGIYLDWEHYAGFVRFDPHFPETLYASTYSPYYYDGHLYKTTNGGDFWFRIDSSIVFDQIGSIAIHPDTTSIIWAAGDSIYKTTNSGKTWHRLIGTGQPVWGFSSGISIDPIEKEILYAGVNINDGCFLKSIDGGNNWIKKNRGLPNGCGYINIDPSSRTIYICSIDGVYESYDLCENWLKIKGLIPENNISALKISLDNRYLYVGMWDWRGIQPLGLYRRLIK